MAGEDDVLVVTLDPEDLKDTSTTTIKPNDDSGKGGGHDDPVADLKDQLQTMQATVQSKDQQLAASQQVARQAVTEAERAKAERDAAMVDRHATEKESIDAGISAADTALKAAKTSYKDAMERGDFEAAGEAQATIASMAAKIDRLTEAKAEMPAAPQKTERREAQPERRGSADPVVAFAENLRNNGSAKSADWISKHPEFVTDQRKNAKMLAGHNDAIAEGIAIESPEYFAHIEKFVGLRQEKPRNDSNGQFQRRPAAPSAPVRNDGGGMTGGNGIEVELTRGERSAATDGTHTWNYDDPTGKGRFKKGDPIGVQEFARRKLIMQRDGHYDKTVTQ